MKHRLNDISKAEFYNKPIRVKCIVSGKSDAPYYVPKTIHIKCLRSEDCDTTCPYWNEQAVTLEPKDENVLLFVGAKSFLTTKLLHQIFRVTCAKARITVEDVQSVERIFISQPTGQEQSKWSAARQAFFIGHDIDVNTTYIMNGYTTKDPSDQSVTHVFTSATKVKSDADTFIVVPDLHARLLAFNAKEETKEAYFEQLDKLYTYYAHNITKIHRRFLLHLSVDAVFHSVMDFMFDGEYVKKGWIDAMIIGDSSIGKGYVAEGLMHYFNVGEIVSAESCTKAGLIAGLQKYGGQWITTWGKIPMNDRGLVIIDEGSNLTEIWQDLTRIRSEGVIENFKIRAQVANARTRLLTLSNPPHGRTVANYSYGIQALTELVPTAEDIRRFDYVYVASNNEVPVSEINTSHSTVRPMYSKALERELIMWMWSRTKDEVDFTDEAVKWVYKRAIRLSEIYDSSIPLIQAENVRIKLAKLAIYFAGRFYHQRDKGRILVVDKVHVDCATLFFHLIYKTEASGYYIYSKLRKEAHQLFEEKYLDNIETYMRTFGSEADEIYRCLLQNNTLTVNDLLEHLSLRREIATEIISKLLQNTCVVRRAAYYVKTPQFTAWLKEKIIQDPMKGL